MKTTYNLISFLSCAILIIILGVGSQKIYGEGHNSGLLISRNHAYPLYNDYGIQKEAFNSDRNNFAGVGAIYYAEDVVAVWHQLVNIPLKNKIESVANDYQCPDPIITGETKGGYSGCTIYKSQYLKGILLPDTKIKFNLYRYNSKGDPTEYIYFDLVSSKSNRETFTYNETGKLTAQITYFKNGAICDKTTYKYSNTGNLIEVAWYESGYRLLNREVYRYDKQNRVVEEIHYSEGDMVVGKDLYIYDEKGKLTEHKGLDINGNVRDLDTYLYDAKNCLAEKKMQSNEPLVLHTYVYKYDEMGNLTQESELRVGKCAIKNAAYNYDAKGKMVTHTVFDNNYTIKDTYNPMGNKVETTIAYKGILNGKVVYVYDVFGNLISETKFNSLNEPYELTDYIFF
jgi:hypothetical protein